MTTYLDLETPEVSNLVVWFILGSESKVSYLETKFTSKWHNILAKDSKPNNIIPRPTKVIAKKSKSLDAEGLQMNIWVLGLLLGPRSVLKNVVVTFFQNFKSGPSPKRHNLFA